MLYDALSRLKSRWVPSTGEVLANNVYDEARAGYYNVGKLTTTSNPALTRVLNYAANGAVQRDDATDSTGTHTTSTAFFTNYPIYKTYWPGPLNVGSSVNPITYDGAGRLKSMPGMILSQAYEADGQSPANHARHDLELERSELGPMDGRWRVVAGSTLIARKPDSCG